MRVTEKPLSQYPWYLRSFFWNQRRKYGQVLGPALVWARAPRLFLAVAALYGALNRRRSPLDPTLRSLVTVHVSQLNHCAFCLDLNSALLAKRAGSLEKVAALAGWQGSSLFDARERAVLEYTEAMTISDLCVTAEHIAGLRRDFGDDAIVELTGLIAFQNLSSKFNAALDVPAQGFCTAPAGDPRSGRGTGTLAH
jgi:AhpD family alkylhydroperoxidase